MKETAVFNDAHQGILHYETMRNLGNLGKLMMAPTDLHAVRM